MRVALVWLLGPRQLLESWKVGGGGEMKSGCRGVEWVVRGLEASGHERALSDQGEPSSLHTWTRQGAG